MYSVDFQPFMLLALYKDNLLGALRRLFLKLLSCSPTLNIDVPNKDNSENSVGQQL